ncbi:MAG TPA: flagellar filament capping protein FliD [Burkholderiaceae bacterium]|nr:flagellar filament capping protein FliD [Burkholderiaceae bacterium]
MASISSAGIGSGLDVGSIITQLMTVEKAPLTQMQKDASKVQSKLSAYGTIQSDVAALRDAAQKLTQPSTWGDTTATSTDSSVVTATTDSSATAGNYSLTVQQLASAQTLASTAWPASLSTLGSGRLRIEMGSWAAGQTSFTAKSGSTATEVVVLATDTLADVRDKINSAKSGVMASIVNDASGARLVLRASETGAANAFRISATDDDGDNTDKSGVSALAFDPSANVNAMAQTQAALDAQATINGLSVTSSSNTLTNVIDGVTLKVGKVSSSPVGLSIESNTASMKTAVTAFADAYNNLAKYLSTQTAYNAGSKTGGTLQGDSGTNSLRSAMRSIIGDTGTMSGAYTRLADVGLNPQGDGTLKVDTTKLDNALSGHLGDVKAVFAASDSNSTTGNGFGTRLREWGDRLLSFDGSLTTRSTSLQHELDANSKKQSDFNNRMTAVETRLRAQYTALDANMAKLNALSSYVTQQITTMNKNSS